MLDQIKSPKSNRFTLLATTTVLLAVMMTTAAPLANTNLTLTESYKSSSAMSTEHSATSSLKTMGGMKHTEGMSMTGDVDYDFAVNMRMHHQTAVEMSQAQLKNGKNPQLRSMATSIIAAQKKEIAVLDKWIKANKKTVARSK